MKKTYYVKFYKGDTVYLVSGDRKMVDDQPYEVCSVSIQDGPVWEHHKSNHFEIRYVIKPKGYCLSRNISNVLQDDLFNSFEEAQHAITIDPNGKESHDPADWWK